MAMALCALFTVFLYEVFCLICYSSAGHLFIFDLCISVIKLNHVSVLQKMTDAMMYCMSFMLTGKEIDGPY